MLLSTAFVPLEDARSWAVGSIEDDTSRIKLLRDTVGARQYTQGFALDSSSVLE